MWWWVQVSGDSTRHAPFRAVPEDDLESVRTRVIAYYENVLAQRAAPPSGWWSRSGRPKKAVSGSERSADPAA